MFLIQKPIFLPITVKLLTDSVFYYRGLTLPERQIIFIDKIPFVHMKNLLQPFCNRGCDISIICVISPIIPGSAGK